MSDQQSSIELLSLQDMTALLLKERGIHEGIYELAVSFNIGVGGFAAPSGDVNPSVMVSVVGFDLRRAPDTNGPLVVDASKVNPKKRRSKKVSVP